MIQQSHFYAFKGNKNRISKRYLHPHVHCSIIHNNQGSRRSQDRPCQGTDTSVTTQQPFPSPFFFSCQNLPLMMQVRNEGHQPSQFPLKPEMASDQVLGHEAEGKFFKDKIIYMIFFNDARKKTSHPPILLQLYGNLEWQQPCHNLEECYSSHTENSRDKGWKGLGFLQLS